MITARECARSRRTYRRTMALANHARGRPPICQCFLLCRGEPILLGMPASGLWQPAIIPHRANRALARLMEASKPVIQRLTIDYRNLLHGADSEDGASCTV